MSQAEPNSALSASLAERTTAEGPQLTGPYIAPAGPPADPGSAPAPAGNRFVLLRLHADGGLGQVHVAHDQELNREVALKEIQARHAADPHSQARFLFEAEVTGSLEHPGIVPVYSLGHYPDGRPYYAMRFIRGDSLKEAIERFHASAAGQSAGQRSLELRKLLDRFLDVCNAIAYAHSRGVLHRDIKPANVMLGEFGETLVVDWGLARRAGGVRAPSQDAASDSGLSQGAGGPRAPSATAAGSVLGTPAYMSPEQAAGRLDLLGPASDVYSLGATLYALLTGRPPFEDRDVPRVLEKVRSGAFAPPRSVAADVPAALEAICLKAMATRPEDRYPSCAALAEDIEHWLADEPVSAWPEPLSVRAGRWVKRRRALVASAAAALLVALVSSLVGFGLVSSAYQQEKEARADAEAQRELAEKNEQKEMLARKEAEKQKRDAETQRGRAERREQEAKEQAEMNRLQLVRQHLATGNRLVNEGDPMAALAWFAEALLLDRGRPEREKIHRLRLGVTLRLCPRLVHLFVANTAETNAAFSPDGRLLALSDWGMKEVRVLDAFTAEPAYPALRPSFQPSRARFSGDGRYLLGAGNLGPRLRAGKDKSQAQLWEARTGKPLPARIFEGTLELVEASPAGGRFLVVTTRPVSGGLFGEPAIQFDWHLFDPAGGKWSTGKGPRAEADLGASARFSPDGSRFVFLFKTFGGKKLEWKGKAQVWDSATLKPLTPVFVHDGEGRHAEFSPDGRRLLTVGSELVRVWDAATGKPVTANLKHGGKVEHAGFTPDGKHVRAVSGGAVYRWDAATGALESVRRTPASSAAAIGFTPDDRFLLTGDVQHLFSSLARNAPPRLWDLDSGLPATPLFRHPGEVRAVRLAPDGRRLLTGAVTPFVQGYETRLWDASTYRPERPVDVQGQFYAPGWLSPDVRRVVISRPFAPNHILDLATGQFTAIPEFKRFGLSRVDFSADGRRLATVTMGDLSGAALVRVWNAVTGQPVSPPIDIKGGVMNTSVRLDRDGRRVVTVVARDGARTYQARVWSVAGGKPEGPEIVLKPPVGASPLETSLEFLPGDRRILFVFRGQAVVVDVATGKPVAPPLTVGAVDGRMDITNPFRDGLAETWHPARLAALAPDGKRLVLSAGTSRARVFDVDTLKPIGAPLVHRDTIGHVAFSPDGRRVVTASVDRTARVWDVATGAALGSPMEHADLVNRAVFSPDGRLVATCSYDGTARVWDSSTGEPVTPALPAADISSRTDSRLRPSDEQPGRSTAFIAPKVLTFTPDGRRLAVSPDHIADLTLWDLAADERPLDDLVLLARVVSGRRLDERGNMTAFDPHELRAGWRKLRRKYPGDFALAAADLARWHEKQAGKCLRADNHRAAAFHLGRLVLEQPNRPGPYLKRGEALAEAGEFRRAAADFARAITLAEAPAQLRMRLALLHLAAGDEKEYRLCCAVLLKRFEGTNRADIANTVAWACALGPDAVPELGKVVALAEKAVAANPKDANLLNTLGCVLYRAGKHEEAVRRLREAIRLEGQGGMPSDWLFLAMAQHRLGQPAAAKRSLAAGVRLIEAAHAEKDRTIAHLFRLSWVAKQEMALFRREAEALLASGPKPP